MSGLGYRVVADVAFTSNGVEILRALGQAVERTSVLIDANTKAITANNRALRLNVNMIRDVVGATQMLGTASRSAAADITAIGAAADRTSASLLRMRGAFDAASMGAAAFGPASAASARVVPPQLPPITRMSAAALGAGIYADKYYSPSWSSGQRALPPWRDAGVPAVVPSGAAMRGPYEPNWRGGAGTGFNMSDPNLPAIWQGQRTDRVQYGGAFQGRGPGPSLMDVAGAAGGVVGIGARIGGVLNHLTGGTIGHLVEGGTAIDAVVEAAKLQALLVSTANITGISDLSNPRTRQANLQAQERIRQTMFETGNQFAMSPVQSAEMFREVARQSQGTPLKLPQMEAMLPYISRMQVVLANTRGMAPEQTTDAAMNFVHLMRMYNEKDMPKGFDLATRMFELSPIPPNQLIKQLTYAAPLFKNLNIPNDQLGAIMLTLARAGYGSGKGATGIADLLQNSLGTPKQLILSPMAAVKNHMLSGGEFNILDKAGFPTWTSGKVHQADAFKLLAGLNEVRNRDMKEYGPEKGSQRFQQITKALFGVQAARMTSLFSDPAMQQVLTGSYAALKDQKSLSLTDQSNAYLNLTTTNVNRALQNFQALMTQLGWIALPAVSKAFRDLGDQLHFAQQWLNSHKTLTKQWSDGMVSAVKSVESYLVEHKQDFVTVGKNAKYLFDEFKPLGQAALDAATKILPLVRLLSDLASGNAGDILKLINDPKYTTSTSLMTAYEKYKHDHPARPAEKADTFHPGKRDPHASTGAPGHVPNGPPHGDPKRGGVSMIINVNGAKDPHATGHEVAMQVGKILDAHFGDPRSLQNSSSESRTHRALPSILTKAIA